MRHFTLLTSILLACLPVGLTLADEQTDPFSFSGNVGVVSDYRFRGLSQTRENPSVQGGFIASHVSGLKASIWASNFDTNTVDAGMLEVDFNVAYVTKINDPLSAEFGATYY